jgi:adenylate cyclase class IV
MREVELKSVVADLAATRGNIERAGATLEFEGKLFDRRYADPGGVLVAIDHVIRLRIYERGEVRNGYLDWKGPTLYEGGYKVREELSTSVGDPDTLAQILERLGYIVIKTVDRRISQFRLGDAVVRFEQYPKMDDLVEVEGTPEAIERAIAATQLPREGFNTDRLPDFVARFEARTGQRALLTFGD